MIILHLIQKQQLRGAEIFAAQLARHTPAFGHTAIIASLFGGNAKFPFAGRMLDIGGHPSFRWIDWPAWRRLARLVQQEQPDIVQANAGDTLKYAVFSKIIFRWKQPIVFRNASMISLYIRSWPARVWNRFLFSFTDKIISVSRHSAADFAQLFPSLKEKLSTVPNGVEPLPARIVNIHTICNQPRRNPVFIHVGAFTFEKNHSALIRIFSSFLQFFPQASLQLVGDGPLRNDIENMVREKGLQANIIFFGRQEAVVEMMAAADALLLPSQIEGLPGVILEAFTVKLPVVAYDVGGISEIVIDGQTGYLVNKGDENAFVHAMKSIVHDKKKNSMLTQNALELVTNNYLSTLITDRFIQEYEQLTTH
ncbi:MAG TPA: glycosyltransferase [Chitinophagaceae bacterium]|nr:glycosyltransferase [Chitinophagaceae bacterium]